MLYVEVSGKIKKSSNWNSFLFYKGYDYNLAFLKNTRTPLHDHVRKNKDWSNAQVVFRFAIIQIIVSVAAIYAVMI